jgi:hypothetical protein
MPDQPIDAAIEAVFRRESGRLIAVLTRLLALAVRSTDDLLGEMKSGNI